MLPRSVSLGNKGRRIETWPFGKCTTGLLNAFECAVSTGLNGFVVSFAKSQIGKETYKEMKMFCQHRYQCLLSLSLSLLSKVADKGDISQRHWYFLGHILTRVRPI
jgi:hypothetical protein